MMASSVSARLCRRVSRFLTSLERVQACFSAKLGVAARCCRRARARSPRVEGFDPPRRVWERLRDALRVAIEDGVKSGELVAERGRSEVAAHLLIGGISSYMQLFVLERQRLTRPLAREIVDALLDGLARQSERRPARSVRSRRRPAG